MRGKLELESINWPIKILFGVHLHIIESSNSNSIEFAKIFHVGGCKEAIFQISKKSWRIMIPLMLYYP